MLFSSVLVDSHTVKNKFFERFFGNFNSLPPNIKEVSIGELATFGLFYNLIEHIEYRQIYCCGQDILGIDKYGAMNLYYVSMFKGYATLMSEREKTIRFFTFDCIDLLKAAYEELPIEEGEWVENKLTSIPRRGIRDFNKNIKLVRPLSEEEYMILQQYVKLNNPGNTGVYILKCYPNYNLRTCYDCND